MEFIHWFFWWLCSCSQQRARSCSTTTNSQPVERARTWLPRGRETERRGKIGKGEKQRREKIDECVDG